MGNSYETTKNKIQKLVSERDRVGKKPLSIPKRIKLLNSTYDAALVYLLQCVTAGTTKNTAALCTVLERTRLEMVDWQRSKEFLAGALSDGLSTGYKITEDDAALEEMFASEESPSA